MTEYETDQEQELLQTARNDPHEAASSGIIGSLDEAPEIYSLPLTTENFPEYAKTIANNPRQIRKLLETTGLPALLLNIHIQPPTKEEEHKLLDKIGAIPLGKQISRLEENPSNIYTISTKQQVIPYLEQDRISGFIKSPKSVYAELASHLPEETQTLNLTEMLIMKERENKSTTFKHGEYNLGFDFFFAPEKRLFLVD